jgi:hypothetical protein
MSLNIVIDIYVYLFWKILIGKFLKTRNLVGENPRKRKRKEKNFRKLKKVIYIKKKINQN